MSCDLTWNGRNECAYSMARQASRFVKNTNTSRFVSLFLCVSACVVCECTCVCDHRYSIIYGVSECMCVCACSPDNSVHGLDLRFIGENMN